MSYAIGVDLGGTKINAGKVRANGELFDLTTETRPGTPEGITTLTENLVTSLSGPDAVAVGVGAAGLVEAERGVLVWGPNVAGENLDFRSLLIGKVEGPVVVDNDANASVFAEHRLGAGVGTDTLVMLTLGTGIGGGIMIGGEIYRGRDFAGEVGHVVIDAGGPRCTCGQRGCWEALCSGRRLDELARAVATRQPEGTIAQLAHPGSPTGAVLIDAARDGDDAAVEALEEMAFWLAMGIINLIAILDPDMVVIGGGVSRAGDTLLMPTREAVGQYLEGSEHRPPTPIVIGDLQDKAGVVGAGLMAWEASEAPEPKLEEPRLEEPREPGSGESGEARQNGRS